MKHTKGPWKVTRVYDEYSNQVNEALYRLENVNHLESLWNARLIASAPELLEQVKQALKFCRNEGIDPTWECALEKVIAKAEGNTK